MNLFRRHTVEEYQFEDIRSYTDQEVVKAIRLLTQNEDFVKTVVSYFLSSQSTLYQRFFKKTAMKKLMNLLNSIEGVEDFQHRVIFNFVVKEIVKRSVKEIHYHGFENLDPTSRYIFMSNHRDIVCDAAFFEAGLVTHGFPTTEIAFGSNLLVNHLVEDLIRSNKGCIVYRGLDMRKQYDEYNRFSAYIKKILDKNKSLWIAHRQGRSKDASHITNPAILKMFHLSQRHNTSLPDYLNFCKIVPIAVSYEREPAVTLMAKSLVLEEQEGEYKKSQSEDLEHIMMGLTGYKGNVTIHVGKPIDFTSFGKNVDEGAAAIDYFIHSHLELYTFNYIAYDRLFRSERFIHMYADDDEQEFDKLYKGYDVEVYEKILLQYANPVKLKMEAKEKK